MVEERRDYVTLWKERACNVHKNKYDYSKMVYKNNYTKVCIICPEHGEFWQTPNNHLAGSGCKYCSASKGEELLRNYLSDNGIEYVTEYRLGEHKYRYDFYLPKFNLLIEYHGEQYYRESWFTQEGYKKSAYMSFETRKDMDYLKMLLAKKRGYYYLVISHKQNSIGVFKAFINKTFKYKYQDKYYKSTNEIMKLLEDKTISAHDIHNKYKLSNPILN